MKELTTRPTLLPTLGLSEAQMIGYVDVWIARVRHTIDKRYSAEWLEAKLREGLRAGAWDLTVKAIKAAEQRNDELADAALRAVFREIVGGAISQRGEGHLQVLAYGQLAVDRAPLTRPRGRRWYDSWRRDLAICFLVGVACREFNLQPTRNRAGRRANRRPSGISIVVAALARHGIHLSEASVQENIWYDLLGELARRAMAERPPESWLAVQ
jgi:hypothetical protein